MKTKTLLALLSITLAFTLTSSARAADLTPADPSVVALTKEETKTIAEEGFI